MSLPPVPDTFRWTQESWGAALRCIPLEAIAPHLFTTRQLGLATEEEAAQAAEAVGAAGVVQLTQVHGNATSVVHDGAPPPAGTPEADAVVSSAHDVAVAVRAADCVPLLIADRMTGAVAAVHAGWRGTAARVSTAALDAMRREFGTKPADVVVAAGPSIGSCCYVVGSELVDAFAQAGHERYLIDRWFVSTPVRGFPPVAPAGALRLDVAGANRDQLVLAGVSESQIHMARLCTAEHLDVLTSFRAEKEKAGRIAGVIRAVRRAG
jgi:YfiH family protein